MADFWAGARKKDERKELKNVGGRSIIAHPSGKITGTKCPLKYDDDGIFYVFDLFSLDPS